jgi:predicted aspartyl protease
MPRIAMHKCFAGTFCLMVTVYAHANTGFQDLITAIHTADTPLLSSLAERTSDGAQQDLARGVLCELAGEDAAAIQTLQKFLASEHQIGVLRFEAFGELGGVYLRNQQYAKAAAAFVSALTLSQRAPLDEVKDLKRALANARAFSGIAPMTVSVTSNDEIPIAKDSMDLPRGPVEINEQKTDAILDTGAGNSVVSVSTAKRLHLRTLHLKGGVVSGGIGRLPAQFGVADSVYFAGRIFRNVPFIILPDEALTVPVDHGSSKLEPIIGLSVLRRLGRIEILSDGFHERLRVAAGGSSSGRSANLLLAGTLPMVLVRANDGTTLRMALDTGANRSALAPTAITAHPGLLVGANVGKTKMAGAGGLVANDSTTIVPQLDLTIGEGTSHLLNVPVSPGPENSDGTLGQDALRSGGGYVIDFVRMTVEILPGAVQKSTEK